MNFRTTLALLVLAATGGAVLWFGASLPPSLHPAPPSPAVVDAGSRDFLTHLDPAKWTRLEIDAAGRPPFVLLQSGGAWKLPGNWDLNPAAVRELTDRIAGLRPHLAPEPADAASLAVRGLDRPAVVVKLEADNGAHILAFGRNPAEADAPPFTQETYVRLDDRPEVLRVGAGLLDELNRPADYYRQRRLFPMERTAKDAKNKERVERLRAKELTVADEAEGGTRFTIVHTADGWELEYPTRDRLDDAARDALLTAVPDLWAERFVNADVPGLASAAATSGGPPGVLPSLFWLDLKAPALLTARTGLDAPKRSVRVTREDGTTVALLIGKSAGTRGREALPGADPTAPPPEPEEFYYAKLRDNDQIFEIKGARLKDVFVAASTLRDPRPDHFAVADATRVEITQGGQQIALVKGKEGDKDSDKWRIDAPLHAEADGQKVNDLLSALANVDVRGDDVINGGRPWNVAGALLMADTPLGWAACAGQLLLAERSYGVEAPVAVVSVTVEEKTTSATDKGDLKTRTLTIRVGKRDEVRKKVYVLVDDWPRINAAADGVSPTEPGLTALVTSAPNDYRRRRPFDFARADVTTVGVRRGDAPEFLLKAERQDDKIVWHLTASGPAAREADGGAASALVEALGGLEVLDFVSDAPKPEELGPQYGLDKPALAVRLEFTGKDKQPQTLEVGKKREGKPGRFARLVGSPSVFAVSDDTFAALDRDALAYVPKRLWDASPADVTAVRVHRKDRPEYSLAKGGDGWKIAGPFEAGASSAAALALAAPLAAPQADACQAFDAKLDEYGLAAPYLTAVLTAKGAEHTLTVGDSTAPGAKTRYARVAGDSAVYVVGDSLMAALDRSPTTLLDPAASKSLALQRPGGAGDVEAVRDGDAWKLVKPSAEDADAPSLNSLSADLLKFRPDHVVEEQPKDLAKYGLDAPEATVALHLGTGDKAPKVVLRVGKAPEPIAGDRFGMVEGEPAVVMVPAALARRLTAGLLTFRDHTIIKVPSDPDRVRLERDPRKAVFSKVEGSWKMTEPLTAELDQDALDDFLNGLLTLRADELVAEKPSADDLKKYGLDNPEAKWRLQNGDKDLLTLLVGKKDGPRAYAMLAGRDLVFLLDPKRTGQALGEFRTRTVWTAPLDAVQAVSLEYRRSGGGGFELAKGDEGWKAVGKPDAKVDSRTVEETLTALAGLKLERYVADKDANLALFGLAPEPEWTVEVRTKSGQRFTLQLGRPEGESKRRYAHVLEPRRTDVFVIGDADAEKIVRDLAAFGKPPAAPVAP